MNDQLTKNNLDSDNRRDLQIDRKNLVFSTMKEFKDRPIQDLFQFIQISYKDETGIDGGKIK